MLNLVQVVFWSPMQNYVYLIVFSPLPITLRDDEFYDTLYLEIVCLIQTIKTIY